MRRSAPVGSPPWNREIAGKLVISVRRAEAHRAHIMQKLWLSTRAELVRYAMDEGVLET
jgi:two-component system response regulator NreC